MEWPASRPLISPSSPVFHLVLLLSCSILCHLHLLLLLLLFLIAWDTGVGLPSLSHVFAHPEHKLITAAASGAEERVVVAVLVVLFTQCE